MENMLWPANKRIGIAATTMLLLLLAVLVAPSAAPAKSSPCPKPRAGGLSTRQAVLSVRSAGEDSLHTLVGCHKRTRRRTRLASWYSQGSSADDPSPQYWLAGRFAALNVPRCTADPQNRTCTATFSIVDLRTGATRATVDALTDPIYEIVLLATGNAAFIHRRQVFTVIAGRGEERERAADSGSLAYASQSGRLYWTSSGQPKTVELR